MKKYGYIWAMLIAVLYVAGLFCLVLFSSCGVSRKTKVESVVRQAHHDKKDSTGSSKQSAVDNKQSERVVRVEKDSVGVVPGGEAEFFLLPEEVEPVTDATGAVTGRTFTKRKGTMTATVTVGKDGGIKFNCKEDSLRLVLFRYRMDSISLVKRLDSLYGEVMITEHSEIKDSVSAERSAESEVRVKGQGWLARTWNGVRNLCTAMVAGWLIFFLIRFFKKVAI